MHGRPKHLLGKVYLTQNKKTEAITVLNDVRLNSGYGLQANICQRIFHYKRNEFGNFVCCSL